MKALKIELWDIESIFPFPANAKKHDEAQVAGIAQSIVKFGWDQPIVVDKAGVIIKGHGRRLAAIKLGYEKVPVLVRNDLSPEQVRAARLADNRAAVGDIDLGLAGSEISDLYKIEKGILDGIFGDKELNALTAQTDFGSMNVDPFEEDMDGANKKQSADTSEKIDEIDDREVPVGKALGFTTIKGRDERAVAMFLAQIEAETGLTGAAAFVKHAESHCEQE